MRKIFQRRKKRKCKKEHYSMTDFMADLIAALVEFLIEFFLS